MSHPPKSSSSKTLVAKATFRRSKLEQSFSAYRQANFAEKCATDQARELIKQPIEFIDNELFQSGTAEKEILGDQLFGVHVPVATKASKLPDLPIHLARLCETKLLTAVEEKELFQRMNYLRYRAEKLRLSIDHKQMSESEAQQLVCMLRAADWYRDSIVKANMRLVISIVKKFVNPNNNFDDLLSDGIVALIRAVEKFDYHRGFRFSTYATQVVRRNSYRVIMQRQTERLQVTASVDEPGMEISEEIRESSMSEARWNALRSRLAQMLDSLDRREKLIIRARFSLGSHRNVKTLQCLADKLGVSKERIRQLEKRSLDKLRDMVELEPVLVEAAQGD